MEETKETGSLHANIQGNSGVETWASTSYLVDNKIFIGTPEGDVAIEATKDGRLRVGPRGEIIEE